MNRSFAVLATLFPAIALGLLVMQWSQTQPAPEPSPYYLDPPVDFVPAQAFYDLSQLRSERGSVLSNSSFDQPQDKQEFATALANYVGEPVPEVEPVTKPCQDQIVQQLRQTARILDEHANTKEDAEDYEAESVLRNLAQQLRLTAKTMKQ